MKTKSKENQLLMEAMEPRLLFSADLDGGLVSGDLSGQTALPSPALAGALDPSSGTADNTRTASEVRLELVLVDTDTPDYQQLIDDLLAQQDDSRHLQVILLDNTRDGIHQVTEILSNFQGLDAVHLISHGSDGSVDLGGSVLDFDSLTGSTRLIQGWGEAFSAGGDFLIYGCNLAATADGQGLVNALGRLTGADVAASDDLTGSAAHGGDWELEFATGDIETAVAISTGLQQNYAGVLATETVADDLGSGDYTGNTGSQAWAGDWIEVDSGGAGAGSGNVVITGGELRISALGSSIAREADLSGATSATVSFDFHTGIGVESADPDSMVIEVSDNGGSTWSTLEDINYLDGVNSGSRSYDISAYTAVNTQIRIRANNGYGGPDEFFYVDNIQIQYTINSAPVLGTTGGAASYGEDNPAAVIDGTITVSDVDSADFAGGILNVSISAGGATGDRLSIFNQGTGAGQIGVSGNDVSYGGIIIGTFSGGLNSGDPLIVNLNASADVIATQALLRNITFWNVSDNPATAARTVDFVLNDGDGGTSNTLSQTVNVTTVADAPVAVNDNHGLDFDGIDDYVSIADSASLTMTNTVTMEAWIKADASANVNRMIINKEGEYEVALFADGTINWAFANTDPGWAWHNTGYTVSDGEWTHVAVSYDNGEVSTYVNGTLVDVYHGSGPIGDAHATLDELRIGGRSNNPAGKHFDGQIDDVRIWNTARTQAQIQSTMDQALTGGEAGLAAYWNFNEGFGTTTADLTVNANTGTLIDGGAGTAGPQWAGYGTNQNTQISITAVDGIVGNDVDGDGDALSVTQVNGSGANVGSLFTLPSGANLTVGALGAFIYDPNGAFDYLDAGETAIDTFTYLIDDGNGGTDTATASIIVTGTEDTPVIGGVDTGAVTEDVAVTAGNLTASGTLTISDIDTSDNPVSFSAGTINGTYGDLTIDAAGNWSYSATNSQAAIQSLGAGASVIDTLTVTTNDGFTHDVLITINGTNDVPVINDQTFNIDENRPMNFVVGTPVNTDPDAGDTFTYSITGGTGATAFAIHNTIGQIRVADPSQINFETNPTFTLDIEVQDAGGQTDTATITININDINERPTLNDVTFTLDENSANGTSVGTMVGTDPDGGDSLTYSIVGGNIGNAFIIDPVTGEITVNDITALNFEGIGSASSPAFAHQTGAANPFNGISVAGRSAPTFVDIDGDGDLDAFVGDYNGNLQFFENIGDATNPGFVQVSGPGNPLDGFIVTNRSTPTFADIDNDGDQDVFVGDRFGGVSFYRNTGNATSPVFVQVAGPANPFNGVNVLNMSAPTLIDIDGDGDLDAFVGEWYGTVKYFENTGDAANPAFTERTGAANPLNGVFAPLCCNEWQPKPTFADLDADGDYDAFIGLKNGTTEYWENTGDAANPVFTLQTGDANPLRSAVTGGGGEAAPAFVDIDGDGDLDVFSGNAFGAINFFENKPVINLTVRAEDSSGLADTATVRIDLTDINEGPTDISLSNNLIDEHIDTTGGYSVGSLSTTDEDGGEIHTYTIVGGVDAALFTIGGAGSDELMLDDGVLDFETRSSYQVMVRVTDSGTPGLTYDKTFTITVNDLNDAPVIAGANDLTAISEDPVSNTGTLVSDLLSGQVSDADAASLEGIAVVGVDNANGTWEYSLNGGGTWLAFGTPGTVSARLLAADASTYVRFVPAPDWNGTVTNGLTFHAWDQSSGTNGGTADLTGNTGGAMAFSSAAASSSLIVNPAPDAPVIGGVDTGSVTEDAGVVSGNLVASGSLTITDPDAGEDSFAAGTIVGTYGSLTIDATGNWNYAADNSQAAIQGLAAGATLTDTLSVVTADGSSHAVAITITGTNDAPVANNDGPVMLNAGTSVTIAVTGNDTDIDNAIDLTSIVIVSGPANGTLVVIANGTVIYTHDGSTTTSDSFTYTILDASGAVSGTATVNLLIDPADIVETPSDPAPEEPPTDDEEAASDPPPREQEPEEESQQKLPQITQGHLEDSKLTVEAFDTDDSADYTVDNIVLVSQDNPGLKQRTLQGMIDKLERFNHELWEVLDAMKKQMSSQDDITESRFNLFVKSATGLTFTLSAGAVTWAIRGTSIMASMLSSMPMWKGFDPLPLLSTKKMSRFRDEEKNNPLSIEDRIAEERATELLNSTTAPDDQKCHQDKHRRSQ